MPLKPSNWFPVDSWIGVDLDGTLATWGGDIDCVGEPIPLMVDRVKRFLAAGIEVRIMTARVGCTGKYVEISSRHDDEEFANKQRTMIKEWCVKHIGQELPVTCQKDFGMMELWDDRAVAVMKNVGQQMSASFVQCP